MKLSTRFHASDRINRPKIMKMTPSKHRIERIKISRILEKSPRTDDTVELFKVFAVATVELLYFHRCPCDVMLIVCSKKNTSGHKDANRWRSSFPITQ
jgi:hypothetical protein